MTNKILILPEAAPTPKISNIKPGTMFRYSNSADTQAYMKSTEGRIFSLRNGEGYTGYTDATVVIINDIRLTTE